MPHCVATNNEDISMEANTMIAMVHRYVEAFEKQDMDIIKEIYSQDALVEDPVGTDVHTGIDAVCAFSLSLGKLPDCHHVLIVLKQKFKVVFIQPLIKLNRGFVRTTGFILLHFLDDSSQFRA